MHENLEIIQISCDTSQTSQTELMKETYLSLSAVTLPWYKDKRLSVF